MFAMIYRPIGKRPDGGEQQGVWIGDIVTLIGATTSVALVSNFVSIMQVSKYIQMMIFNLLWEHVWNVFNDYRKLKNTF
jgi:hypothetical protein